MLAIQSLRFPRSSEAWFGIAVAVQRALGSTDFDEWRLFRNKERAFGLCCATPRLGTTSHPTWNLKSRSLGSKIRSHYPDDLVFTAAEPFVKVFRSDSGEPISNSYILLSSETDEARHFDTRTDEKGEYLFGGIRAGNYTVSIYAWFPKRSEVPCQNPLEQKTADGGDITVEWQWKSRAFMEIVKLIDFSIEFDRENVKDFDLVGK